jgi:hypothetical protein
MDDLLDEYAVCYGLDNLCDLYDIRPGFVLRLLIEEGLIDADDILSELEGFNEFGYDD